MAQPRRTRSQSKQPAAVPPPSAGPGAVGGAVGTAAGQAPGSAAAAGAMVTGAAAQAALASSILAALLALLLLIFRRRKVIMIDVLGKRGIPTDDVKAALRDEEDYEKAFRDKARKRIKRQLKLALAAPDDSARAEAIQALLRREQHYARMRAAAAANRVLAAAERQDLRRVSPSGAYWQLGIRKVHTPDCIAMAGKFWPWSILNIVHPLLHVGCGCSLKSYGWALANGKLGPGALLSQADQARIAGPVINHVRAHQAELDALNEMERAWDDELTVREMLTEAGHDANVLAACPFTVDLMIEAYDPDQPRWPKGHPRAGQWRPKLGAGTSFQNKQLFKAVQDELGEHMTNVGSLGRLGDSDGQAIRIGQKVVELADAHGTVAAYQKRLDLVNVKVKAEDEKLRRGAYKVLGLDYDPNVPEGPYSAISDILANEPRWEYQVRQPDGREISEEKKAEIRTLILARTRRTVPLWVEQSKLTADVQRAHRDALVGVLSSQRGMGGSLEAANIVTGTERVNAKGGLSKITKKDVPEVERKAKEALAYLPTEWIEFAGKDHLTELAAGPAGKDDLGTFYTVEMESGDVRYLLQTPGDVSPSTMLHEIGHRMEVLDMNDDGFPLAKYGEHWRKARAETIRIEQLSGYAGGVKGQKGSWRREYTGRVYSGQVANEVLTTSLQELFYPSPATRPHEDESQQVYWVAGLLAAY